MAEEHYIVVQTHNPRHNTKLAAPETHLYTSFEDFAEGEESEHFSYVLHCYFNKEGDWVSDIMDDPQGEIRDWHREAEANERGMRSAGTLNMNQLV